MKINQFYQKYHVMINNFSYISSVKFISIILPLVTFPYLIRTLGAEKYGIVMWAWAIAQILIALIQLGFDTLGTKLVSENREDTKIISKILAQITVIKLILFAIVVCIIFFLISFEEFNDHKTLFFTFTIFIFFESMLPIWYFQGIEEMKFVAISNLLTKLFFACSIFIFVDGSADYLVVPTLYGLGSMLSLLFSILIISRHKLNPVELKLVEIVNLTKESFIISSAIIGTVLRDKVIIILIQIYLGPVSVAYFDLAHRVINILLTPFHVVGNVIYPHIAKTRDVKFLVRIIAISLAISSLITAIFFVNIKTISFLLLGSYDPILINIFKFLILVVPIGTLSSLLSKNVIVVFGASKYYAYAMFCSSMAFLALFSVGYVAGILNLHLFVSLFILYFIVEATIYLTKSVSIIKAHNEQTCLNGPI
jgi:polysaccharide transporter, PST family